VEFKSSLNEIDRFIGSHIYDDMIAVFEDWLAGAQEKLEVEQEFNEVLRLQGSIRAMRDVLDWPVNFRDDLEEQSNDY